MLQFEHSFEFYLLFPFFLFFDLLIFLVSLPMTNNSKKTNTIYTHIKYVYN